MGTYVLLTSLTPEGGQTLHAHPERMVEVNREIADFGCTVVSQYALLGPYDFLTVVEAPDNETIAHLATDTSGCTRPAAPTTGVGWWGAVTFSGRRVRSGNDEGHGPGRRVRHRRLAYQLAVQLTSVGGPIRHVRTGQSEGTRCINEPPRIVGRERIDALLAPIGSFAPSDVNIKEHIVAVVW